LTARIAGDALAGFRHLAGVTMTLNVKAYGVATVIQDELQNT